MVGIKESKMRTLWRRQYNLNYADKGGSYLDLKTVRDEDHYAYNREFQRLFHTVEGLTPDSSIHSKQLLTDLGVNVVQSGAPKVAKRSAHEKYF